MDTESFKALEKICDLALNYELSSKDCGIEQLMDEIASIAANALYVDKYCEL